MPKPCSFCGRYGHSQTFCRLKPNKPIRRTSALPRPKKPIRRESVKAYRARTATYKKWLKANPPDATGHWGCYLHISELCLGRVTVETLTLEHVIPRSHAPELKYDISNIRPSCAPCNKLKGSRKLEELAKIWPHLASYTT